MVKYEEYEETCWKCRGKGVLIKTYSVFRRNVNPAEATEDNFKTCPRCNGTGFKIKKRKVRDR